MEASASTIHGPEGIESKRVVEYELRMPRLEEIKLPRLHLEPWRAAAEETVITALGVGILVARGLRRAVEVAHEAGAESSQRPGTLSHALAKWLRPTPKASQASRSVQVLAIEDYDRLSAEEIQQRVPALSTEQRRSLRAYEIEHQRRTDVLKALDALTAGA